MHRPAVIALHYQNDILHPDGLIRVGLSEDDQKRTQLLVAAKKMLDGARAHGWPIIHVRVAYRHDYADLIQNAPILKSVANIGAVKEGSWGSDFYQALAPREDCFNEHVVTHKRINPFYDTQLCVLLRGLNIERVLIAGVATHSVVESTARHAVDCGFHVTVAADACASASSESHNHSLNSMRLIAEVSDVQSTLEALK
ncbi:cysteine hydrolase family protein [Halomonas sp. H5]|uniref:cysteine hydrolase family protein n=1 Tax=Halomonas sp. H5 TaxID=3423910 RepID=UPI003D362421